MALIKGLSQFKSKLSGGGARPNLFEVQLSSLPIGITEDIQALNSKYDEAAQEKFTFLCKAAALPASNVAPIEVPFRGRTFKVAGDRTFDSWTITIINDSDFLFRNVFENWMQNVNQYSDHSGLTSPVDYMTNATVFQLGRGDVRKETGTGSGGSAQVLAQYKFIDIFPTNISQIDLSYDTSDTIEEFTVELQVQFWFPEAAGSNNASSDDIP